LFWAEKMAKRKKNARRVRDLVPRNPPPYDSISRHRRVFRYYASTAFASGTLNEAQMLIMPGTMCTVVNTTVVATQVSVKIHRITIWGTAPAAGGGPSTVSIRYFGVTGAAINTTAAMLQKSDTSVNPAHSPVVSFAPPTGCAASFWLSSDNLGSDQIIALNCPQYSVIDFDLEFEKGMPPAVGAFTYPIAAGNLGTQYWLQVTAPSGTGVLTPTDLASTA